MTNIHFAPPARRAICVAIVLTASGLSFARGDEYGLVRPLIEQKCFRCHGEEEVNGEVDFQQITSQRDFLERPELLANLIDAIDGNNMPPEDEPQFSEQERAQLLSSLKVMLREAAASHTTAQLPIRRLNRFQYNYAVKDLFQLRLDAFPLPEKLMTRHSGYLRQGATEMPHQVNVASYALEPKPGLKGVIAFPKDLRAAHGFDNQANELTLSPLLLDSFLRLSVSIVESPDFNEQNVGVWGDLFQQPDDEAKTNEEVERRLRRFLTLAFRAPVDDVTLARYNAYALNKMEEGLSFTDSMKKAASAALSSPRFLYRATTPDPEDDQFELASNLSFFLWSSGPDEQLLRLAERGELTEPEVLNRTIDRMFADPKIERFLDTFPTQWMQLENILAVTPDPELHRYFRLDEQRPAGLQMVLEPLLLFDAVFIEDRPIVELLKPEFSYRSEFLTTWYTSELKPKAVDAQSVLAENRRNDQLRQELQTQLQHRQKELTKLQRSVKQRLLASPEKEAGERKPVDWKPYAGMTPDERKRHDALAESIALSEAELKDVPPFRDPAKAKQKAQDWFEDELRRQLQLQTFRRVELTDPRYGGVITNAAMLSMTSGARRTHPIARGAWIIEVILNDPPPPPPNDVPPLNEDAGDENQTIRERLAAHRDNPSCAGCHARLDPLGFALENFDVTGRWRHKYPNGREVDASGTLLRKHKFDTIVQFKEALRKEDQRFAKALTEHLLRFATSRELTPADAIAIDTIIKEGSQDDFRLKSLVRRIVLSDSFLPAKRHRNSQSR